VSLGHAATTTDNVDRLMVLAEHDLAIVTPASVSGWSQLVDLSRSFGDCQRAVAFRDTIYIDGCYLVTAEPERYPDLDLIIDVSHG
jgi:hypothetical protein